MEHWQILSFILEKINLVLYVNIVMSHLTYLAKQQKKTNNNNNRILITNKK